MDNGVSAAESLPRVPDRPVPPVGRQRGIGSGELAELKLEFLASLNHEIRTPLSGILGMTDLLLETALNDEQQDYVSAVRQCAEELSTLLNATLEYTSLASGSVRVDETEFQVADALQAALSDIQLRAEEKGLELDARFDPSLSQLASGDPVRIKQIASLLLNNAVKFTAAGRVTLNGQLDAANNGWQLVFEIRDTGIGMSLEDRDRVLSKFCQLEGGLSRRFSGLGLGLALVQKLLDLMNGSMSVESEPGNGCCFQVRIPLQYAHTHTHRAVEPPSPRANGSMILLVEDNRISQQVISYMLTKAGFKHQCVESGIEAVLAAGEHHFDAILMDLQMPGMDGIEATHRIREMNGYVRIPILALTANNADEVRDKCRAAGMDGYLTKPLQSQELIDALHRFGARATG
jgi:two-component system, sensor histidine kinase